MAKRQNLRESCIPRYTESVKFRSQSGETASQKRLKNEYYRELADNINTVTEAREVDKEFSMAKTYTTFKPASRLQISNEKMKTHFEMYFAAGIPKTTPAT